MEFTELIGIDLGFRPKSYFWPLGLETHLLSRIKGAERKAALQRLIDSGNLEGIPDFLAESALSSESARRWGGFTRRSWVASTFPTCQSDAFAEPYDCLTAASSALTVHPGLLQRLS